MMITESEERKVYLRKLKIEDAPLMLEWMHDDRVTKYLRTDFSSKTIEDCERFIKSSWNDEDVHKAIVSDSGEYMGTVTLKKINRLDNSAEISIVVRYDAMRRGYSWFAIESIISDAFEKMGLESVYWCVFKKDTRSIRFYDKHNFHETIDIPKAICDRYNNDLGLKWYSVLKGDVLDDRKSVVGCKVVRIKTIPTVNAGELSFFEANHDIPFDINRIYYISKVPEGIRRGFHAHKDLKQLLFCPYGRIQLILENELGREEIELSDPSIAVMIDRPTWREMLWLQRDSVLCVAASDYYIVEDYIRDYNEFKEYVRRINDESTFRKLPSSGA